MLRFTDFVSKASEAVRRKLFGSIRTKLAVVTIMILTVPMAVGIFRSLRLFGGFAEKQGYEKLYSDLVTLRMIYENRKGQMETFVRSVSTDNTVKITASLGRGSLLGEQLGEYLAKLLKEDIVDMVTITDFEGRVIARGTNPQLRDDDLSGNELVRVALAGEKITGTQWVSKEELTKEGLLRGGGFDNQRGKLMIQSACPIYDEGEIVGTVLVGCLVNQNPSMAVELGGESHINFVILSGSRVALINIKDGEVKDILGDIIDISTDKKMPAQPGGCYLGRTSIRGEDFMCYFSPLQDVKGETVARLVALKDVYAIAAMKHETVTEMVLIFLIGLGLALALGVFLLGYAMTKSLLKLTKGAERIADGDLSTPIEVRSGDEIGILADSFNRMTKELKRSRDKIEDYSRTLEQKVEERTKELQQEVNERKRAEEQIKTSLKEKEVLLKEIHHRVKNNLQIISSLLYLQSKNIKDQKALGIFRDSQNRVKSMALIHEKLYRSEDLARIDFAEYVRSLTNSLFGSYGVNSDAIKLKVNVDDFSLGLDTAIPCGLVINELVSNSFKYAFPDGRGGEIRIDLHTDNDGRLALIVCDNGVGLPEGLDFRNTGSLGLQLVNTLINQLDGTVELDRSGGTEFKIAFPRTQT